MDDAAHWVHLTDCATGFEADLLRSALEAEDIPALVRGPQAGFLGPTFQGSVVGGVAVHVPSPEIERAREILEDSIRPDGG